jgi:hypothetical protein
LNRFSDTLWTVVRWAVPVTVAAVIAAVAIGSNRLGEEVRIRAEARLARECPDLVVQVQGASVVSGEGLVRRHRADGGILPADGPDKETRIGISRYDRRAGLAPSSKRRSRIEREAPLRILPGMTLQAADGQKRFDPAAERAILRRGGSGSRRSEER